MIQGQALRIQGQALNETKVFELTAQGEALIIL